MINRFNKWLDALREPWRFMMALVIVNVGMLALAFGNGPVKLAGVLYIGILFYARVIRRFNAAA